MPIFFVRVTNQQVKDFTVNCASQEEARIIVSQNLYGSDGNQNVVLVGDSTNASTEIEQAEISAKWEDYASKGLR